MKKVLVAMSGGVDSSVVALKLKEKGFLCEGITAIMSKKGPFDFVKRAQSVCEKIKIKHNVVDFSKEFEKEVIEKFIKTYEEGKTPNPCILCNKHFKFKRLLDLAKQKGFDFLATGHYAKIVKDEEENRFFLTKSKNVNKDQSYFLYFLNQEQLKSVLFPLEDLDKEYVKKIALQKGFESAKVKESQDICFVGKEKYHEYIRKNSNINWLPGKFVNEEGKVLGQHKGVINYTVGQRKGIGLSFKEPMFVKQIDPIKNEVVLSNEIGLFQNVVFAKIDSLYITKSLKTSKRCTAKIRFRQAEEEIKILNIEDDILTVYFKNPQRAVAKGQALVLYEKDYVLGGGEIC